MIDKEIPDKKGYKAYWIQTSDGGVWTHDYKCSNCGYHVISCQYDLPKYCGNCGRLMNEQTRDSKSPE